MIKITTKTVIKNIDLLNEKTLKKAVDVMESTMASGEALAKANAPWTDRTGNARGSIYGRVIEISPQRIVGALGIIEDYGKYLELRWNGRYRIVFPTISYLAQKLPVYLSKVLGK